MTIFNNKDIDRLFHELMENFGTESTMEMVGAGSEDPIYYGYTITIGSDKKPIIKEYGNVKPTRETISDTLVDTMVDKKNRQLKLVAEMPGVEKQDIAVEINNDVVNINAKHGKKKYNISVPITHKIVKDSTEASYKNGILEVVMKLVKQPANTTVRVK